MLPRATATRNVADLPTRQPQPVVGHRAGHCVRRFDDVQPVHRVAGLLDLAPRRERAAVLDRVRAAAEEVAVEREDAVDLGEVVLRNELLPEGDLRSLERLDVVDRLVGVPRRLRQRLS